MFELPALPPAESPLKPWYDDDATRRAFRGLLSGLEERRAADAARLAGMKARGRAALWWPFTQHDHLTEGKINLLDSAYGDYFCVADVEGGAGEGGEGGEAGSEVRQPTGKNKCRWKEDRCSLSLSLSLSRVLFCGAFERWNVLDEDVGMGEERGRPREHSSIRYRVRLFNARNTFAWQRDRNGFQTQR